MIISETKMHECISNEEVNNNGDADSPIKIEKLSIGKDKEARITGKLLYVAPEQRKVDHGQRGEFVRNNGLKERGNFEYKPTVKLQCEICGKSFTSKQSLKYHFKVHTGDYGYRCEGCGKKFIMQSRMQKCMDTHNGIFRFHCAQCNYKTNTASLLRKHQATHRSKKWLEYKTRVKQQCDMCGKTFTKKQSLNYHFKVHAGDYGYKCDGCGKKFIKQSRMQKCMDTHNGIFRYYCTQCDYKTNTASLIKKHQTIHNLERPFICTLCDNSYKTKKVLRTHVEMVHCKKLRVAVFNIKKRAIGLNLTKIDDSSRERSEPFVHRGIKSEDFEDEKVELNESEDKIIKCEVQNVNVIEQKNEPGSDILNDDSKVVRCKVCDRGLDVGESLMEHLVSRHLTIEGQCDVCGEDFGDFIDHFRIHLCDSI